MHIISFMLLLIVSIKLITFGWKLKLVYNSTLLWTENKLPELLTIDASHQISNLSILIFKCFAHNNCFRQGRLMLLCAWTLWPHMVQIPEASFVDFFSLQNWYCFTISECWSFNPVSTTTTNFGAWQVSSTCQLWLFFLENYQVIMGDMMMFLSTFY